MLQATSRLVDVTANDWPGSNPNLAVTSVTQPLSGTTSVEANQVRFTPWLDFNGEESFNYTIIDGNGLGSSARVAVVVADPLTTRGEPQHLPILDPSAATTLTVNTPAGSATILLPAGAIPSGPFPSPDTFDLVFTELTGPSSPLPDAVFGGRAFVLHFFINAVLQEGYVFTQPIFITLSYDPALVPDPSKLSFLYYDEAAGQWSSDGISIVAVDPTLHTFTVSIAHLTEFAAAVQAPTDLEVAPEPLGPFRLYLPAVSR